MASDVMERIARAIVADMVQFTKWQDMPDYIQREYLMIAARYIRHLSAAGLAIYDTRTHAAVPLSAAKPMLSEAACRAICRHFDEDPDKLYGPCSAWALVQYAAAKADHEPSALGQRMEPWTDA